MKKIFSIILCLISVMFITMPNLVKAETVDYEIKVNGQVLDTSKLPYSAYKKGETVMVPVRAIAEALGYDVVWLPKTNQIIIEDVIQKAVITKKSKTVQFIGKLQIIDLSQDVEFDEKIITHQKVTYVPVEFFEYFFNDVSVEGTNISVSPSMSELH